MERDQALKFMHDLLRLMSQKNGSDLFITANFPPAIKVDGKITPVSNQILSAQHTADLARSIMNDRQAAEFEATKECNFAISPSGIGRFRVNALIQQGRVAVATFAVLIGMEKLRPHSAAPLVAVGLAIAAAWFFDLEAMGEKTKQADHDQRALQDDPSPGQAARITRHGGIAQQRRTIDHCNRARDQRLTPRQERAQKNPADQGREQDRQKCERCGRAGKPPHRRKHTDHDRHRRAQPGRQYPGHVDQRKTGRRQSPNLVLTQAREHGEGEDDARRTCAQQHGKRRCRHRFRFGRALRQRARCAWICSDSARRLEKMWRLSALSERNCMP